MVSDDAFAIAFAVVVSRKDSRKKEGEEDEEGYCFAPPSLSIGRIPSTLE